MAVIVVGAKRAVVMTKMLSVASSYVTVLISHEVTVEDPSIIKLQSFFKDYPR